MVGSISAPLLLLRKVRDVMRSTEPVQFRLDQLVRLLASELQAEVCSIYLLRAGEVLELYANIGLNPGAVHLTRLQVGEGLVGEIAATAEALNLAEAQHHPKFAYRPETGEEIYHAFAGVPILHGGQVMGVLVLQRRAADMCTTEQMEVLQTITMLLAELVAAGAFVALKELKSSSGSTLLTQHLTGIALSPGLARAPAILHRARIEIHHFVSENPAHEMERLNTAIVRLRSSLGMIIEQSGLSEDDERREIIEAMLLFAEDKGWLHQIKQAIEAGLTAEAAVRKVEDQLRARMAQVASDYIRERVHDLEELSARLIAILMGDESAQHLQKLPPKFILVAKTLGAAELIEYGHKRVRAVVLEEGSASSHVSILARAMDIPLVGKVADATLRIQPGEKIIVNGDTGDVFLRPSDSIDRQVTEHLRHKRERAAHFVAMQHLPPVTQDGVRINLMLNVGLIADPEPLKGEGVGGIGLYRTELPYMTAAHFPTIAMQRDVYRKLIEQVNGKRIIFRSFDIGGDKRVPYLEHGEEENPAMGWRATRVGLDRPTILRRQFRALIEAASAGPLDVMFPFISHVGEFTQTKRLFMQEWKAVETEGHMPLPSQLRVGAMLEVPSILFDLPALLSSVDFVSVGSNDLFQFLFACDRGSQHMVDRYDTLSPVMLRVLKFIVESCNTAGVEVGFCGDMARKPLEAMCLMALGFRNLSMPASAIGPMKAMTRSLNLATVRHYLDYVMQGAMSSVREPMRHFAQDRGVVWE